ncbi:uncharacterized protein YukE [Streptomyces sp. LBL]|uniref:WXG100 family type VII secretion target n=1 Tax=Streptomyces sp. LBL TaxID=2940562 RepID=UPI002475A117|nr:hypothetical protein [Streptomyces sp. LBL]MDH6624205.1 uncharacterized protein YukE [Streptomyces sp. LBL]
MSGEQKQQDPHAAEQEQVTLQAGVINSATSAMEMVDGFFGGNIRLFSKTDFEGHALNDMIDMVESANPEHLETAGQAIWDAQTAIQEAADELKDHIKRVEWEGEAAAAFHTWGGNLVQQTVDLAAFAATAGTQIMAAATGLASVKKSMPPRDTRLAPKRADEIPAPMQVEGNKDYAAAVKAEKDRQEAINQMNRLASFYAVSEEALAAQQPPTFTAMPDVGVPKPDPAWRLFKPGEARGSGELRATRESAVSGHDSSSTASGHSRSGDTTPPLKYVDDSTIRPDADGNVATKIDSVGTLPPQETARPTTSSTPPVTVTGGGSGGSVPPFTSGTVPPALGRQTGRASGFGGANGNKLPLQAQGRSGTPSGTTGRGTTGPMARSAATGQPGARGGGSTAGSSPMGRGISGGTPRPAEGPVSGRAGGAGPTGAARGNGVVGGRPTTAATPGSTGSRRVPRGTVVGAEGNTRSRPPAGNVGQRGVIGASNSTPGARPGQPARPPAGNSNGVVGTPKGRAPAGTNGGVPGGRAAAAQGPKGNRRKTNREDREGERQPETQRRDAPPATD